MRLKKRPREEYSEMDKLIHKVSVVCRQEAKQVLRFELQKALRSERKKGKELDLNKISRVADIKAITPDSVSVWCLHRMGLVRSDMPLEGTERAVVNDILKHQRMTKLMREFQPRISRLQQPPNSEKGQNKTKGVVGHYGPATRQTKGAVQQVRAETKSCQLRKRMISNAVTTSSKPQIHERQSSSRSSQKVNKAQAKGKHEASDVKSSIHSSWAAKLVLKEREALDFLAPTIGKKTKFADSDDE